MKTNFEHYGSGLNAQKAMFDSMWDQCYPKKLPCMHCRIWGFSDKSFGSCGRAFGKLPYGTPLDARLPVPADPDSLPAVLDPRKKETYPRALEVAGFCTFIAGAAVLYVLLHNVFKLF